MCRHGMTPPSTDDCRNPEAYRAQISQIEQRAEMIRRCFILVLIALIATIVSCLLLGGRYLTAAPRETV